MAALLVMLGSVCRLEPASLSKSAHLAFWESSNCKRDGRPACLSLPVIRVREFNHTILTNRRLKIRLDVSNDRDRFSG
jgi:hypothetical protein